ncbi:AsmA family protein [Kordiimonas aestuarii]|uniref:AsmA family protein n=1 Tax=Kordiimonas aestuarii TaxID=1005925 RepID=UPI0021D350FF|nr:AsmA family protein [Kordiimonas aestuarii]
MKKFLLLILILLVGGGAYAYYKLDTIVKTGVETKGPEVLKVPVGVKGISLSPFSGSIGVNGLTIGQPEGFGDGQIATLEGFDMKVSTKSLFSDHIIIDSIMVDAPKLDIRSKGAQTNFQALQKAIGYQASTEPTNVTLTIKKMTVKGPEIAVLSEGGMLNVDERIKLEDFTITDLGTDEKGLAPQEIARHVMAVLEPQIAKALVKAQASGKLQELTKGAEGKLEKGIGSLVGKLKKKTDDEKEEDGNN